MAEEEYFPPPEEVREASEAKSYIFYKCGTPECKFLHVLLLDEDEMIIGKMTFNRECLNLWGDALKAIEEGRVPSYAFMPDGQRAQ